jgi:hypothetical protein
VWLVKEQEQSLKYDVASFLQSMFQSMFEWTLQPFASNLTGSQEDHLACRSASKSLVSGIRFCG